MEPHELAPPGQQPIQVFEQTIYTAFLGVGTGRTPEGHYIVSFFLPGGRKLDFVLNEQMADAVHKGTSPIAVASPSALEGINGHGQVRDIAGGPSNN